MKTFLSVKQLVIIFSLVFAENEDYCKDSENHFDGVFNYPKGMMALTRSVNESQYKLWFLKDDHKSAANYKSYNNDLHPRSSYFIGSVPECKSEIQCKRMATFNNTFTQIKIDMISDHYKVIVQTYETTRKFGPTIKQRFNWDEWFGKYNQDFSPITYWPEKHLLISVTNGRTPILQWNEIQNMGKPWNELLLNYWRGMVFVSAFYWPKDKNIYFIIEYETNYNESDKRVGYVYLYEHEQVLGWNASQAFKPQKMTAKEWFGCETILNTNQTTTASTTTTTTTPMCSQTTECPEPIPCPTE